MKREWPVPDETPVIGPQELHVWRISLHSSHSIAALRAPLCHAEQLRADRFRFDLHRNRYIVARNALRHLLARYLSREPESVEFEYGIHGKPALASSMISPITFNLSHSDDMALAAFTMNSRIGVDIEKIEADRELDKLATRYFAPSEVEAYHNFPVAQRPEVFYRGWTRKEAFIKTLGEGLSHGLDSFSVSLTKTASFLHVDGDESIPKRWSLLNLDAAPGFCAAVAVETTPVQLKTFEYAPN